MKSKKLIFPIVLSLFLLLLLWHVFLRLPGLPVDPLEAVSSNAAIVLAAADGRTFFQKDQTFTPDRFIRSIWSEPHLRSDRVALRRVLGVIPELQHRSYHLLFALQNIGVEHICAAGIIDLRRTGLRLDTIIARLQPVQAQPSVFRGSAIYRLILPDRRAVTLSKYRNLLLVSEYPLLVEESLARLKRFPLYNWINHRSTWHWRHQDAEASFSIFVQPENLSALLSNWLAPAGKEWLSHSRQTTDWWRLDFRRTGGMVQLRGSLAAADDGQPWAVATLQRPASLTNILQAIPDDLIALQWMPLNSRRAVLQLLPQNFRRHFRPWLGNEMAVAYMPTGQALVFRTDNRQAAEAALQALGQETGLLRSYQYQTYPIRQLMEANLFGELTLPFDIYNPSAAVIDDYVVFATSRAMLEVWIDEYLVGKTLARDANFLRMYQPLQADPAQFFYYASLVNFAPRLRETLRTEGLLQSNQPEQLGAVALSFRRKGGDWQIRGAWLPALGQNAVTHAAGVLWKTPLDIAALTPPMPVGINPLQPEAIAIQDSAFNFYLLSRSGEILWKKKLEGPILSKVHSIEYYEPGTVSLLFNTANNIHLLQFSGEPQSTFPLRLQTPATNGVTVVDFNRNRDFCFFVACANGAIYGFDKLGRPLPGWNPLRGVSEVRHPVVHFQYKERDYLTVLNTEGKMMVYQRNGSNRFAPLDFRADFPSPPQVELSPKSNRIVAADAQGVARVVGMDGSAFRLQLLPKAGAPARFAFADISADERKEYLALSGNLLVVSGYEGNKFTRQWQMELDALQDEVCAVAAPGHAKAVAGTVSRAKRQISLFRPEGGLYLEFPLAGSTTFFIADLQRNGQPILLVGNSDSVYAYRIQL